MEKELRFDLLRVLVKHGILPETFLRNEEIKNTYAELRETGVKGKDAREQLADKYFISAKSIEFILYGKKNN